MSRDAVFLFICSCACVFVHVLEYVLTKTLVCVLLHVLVGVFYTWASTALTGCPLRSRRVCVCSCACARGCFLVRPIKSCLCHRQRQEEHVPGELPVWPIVMRQSQERMAFYTLKSHRVFVPYYCVCVRIFFRFSGKRKLTTNMDCCYYARMTGNLHQVREGGGAVLGPHHEHSRRGVQEQAGGGTGV